MGLEILTFLGLAIVFEGMLMALFPGALRRMMAEMSAFAPERLRRLGLLASILGAAFLFVLAHMAGANAGTHALGFSAFRAMLAGIP